MQDSAPPPIPTPTFNPYAPPQASIDRASATGDQSIIRDGNVLIVQRGQESLLPKDSCIKCGAPATKVLKRNSAWHHPAYYALILISPLVYIIAAVIAQKRMKLECGLCLRHTKKRFNILMATWGCLLAALLVAAGGGAIGLDDSVRWIGVATLLLAFLILAVIASRLVLLPKKITKTAGAFTGAGEDFLANIPSVPGASRF